MSTSVATRRRGFTPVASGRVCRLPERHGGPCDLRYLALPATATPSRGPQPTHRLRRCPHDATPSTYEEHS